MSSSLRPVSSCCLIHDQDAATLLMILGFWFVDRAIRKFSGK